MASRRKGESEEEFRRRSQRETQDKQDISEGNKDDPRSKKRQSFSEGLRDPTGSKDRIAEREKQRSKIAGINRISTEPERHEFSTQEKPEVLERLRDKKGKVEPKKSGLTEAITDDETGELIGIKQADGTTFFLPAGEAQNVLQKQTDRLRIPEGAPISSDLAAEQRRLAQGAALSAQVGVGGEGAFVDQTQLDVGQAAKSAATGVIPSVISGATSGGIIGGVGTGGVGAPVGAAIGAIGGLTAGFASGFLSELRGQVRDFETSSTQSLSEGAQNLNDLVNRANQDPANAGVYLGLFNKQLTNIESTRQQLIFDTEHDLNKYLGGNGIKDLEEFEVFNNGERINLVLEMKSALENPDPTKIGLRFQQSLTNAEL